MDPTDQVHIPIESSLGPEVESIHTPPTTQPETNHEWNLKSLSWPDPRVGGIRRDLKIICQNVNGPCSLISLCNVLILRGSIHVDPSRYQVDYDYLSSLIGDFLVERPQGSSSLSLESALSILPTTVHGLSVNPSFKSVGAFSTEHDSGELALFELCGVKLTHGWVVDPANVRESEVLQRIDTYDAAQTLLVEGLIAQSEVDQAGNVSEEQTSKIQDAAVVKEFLDNTKTQLTLSGLFGVLESLQPGEVVALFRNSHLSVLYKRPPSASDPNEPVLFSLVTDDSFKNEPEIVWESLADVQGTLTGFVNADFQRSSTAGGDIAGLSAEAAYHRENQEAINEYDQQLARQLQSEEDERTARQFIADDDEPRPPAASTPAAPGASSPSTAIPKVSSSKATKKQATKEKDRKCLIM